MNGSSTRARESHEMTCAASSNFELTAREGAVAMSRVDYGLVH